MQRDRTKIDLIRAALFLLALSSSLATCFADDVPTLEEAKAAGRRNSEFLKQDARPASSEVANPQPKLAEFAAHIKPSLTASCQKCHGPDTQEAGFRIDTLNPDLQSGPDIQNWLEVFNVLSNGEMPPQDTEGASLPDKQRSKIIDWLSSEIQMASQVRRSEQGHSSFRRLTRYEYNYALQDLLGLPFDFAKDLPPETPSEDGFENSSEMLQMSAMQFEQYRNVARQALSKATVAAERPQSLYYDLTMKVLSAQSWKSYDSQLETLKERFKDDPETLEEKLENARAKMQARPGSTHFKNKDAGVSVAARWGYMGASAAPAPTTKQPDNHAEFPVVAIIPRGRSLKVHVRDELPDAGNMRIRILASRTKPEEPAAPTLSLSFGHQASNNSQAADSVKPEIEITALPGKPEYYQWDVPLSEIVRNPYRGVTKLGTRPNPGEFIEFFNTSLHSEDVQIDYLEVVTSAYDQWPPASHRRVFIDSSNHDDETKYARDVLANFIRRAWRRPATASEIELRMKLFAEYRSTGLDAQDATLEVLATVLSSPNFLYITQADPGNKAVSDNAAEFELATRLAMFLWCSVPDDTLLKLAETGKLSDPSTLVEQAKRMLADPKGQRFSKHFVRQWLGMQLLDYLAVDKKVYGNRFTRTLKESMQREPIAFFDEVRRTNGSVMDFLHADYIVVNNRLAAHYQIDDVPGMKFRRVPLQPGSHRGGMLTQAGLLAMNSDGKDSHPLKRGIWLLERMLNDPPPPPPPNVPEVDLTDPRILEMTLKERIEDHRNHPACYSCHARIDPWGIAFENFDAIGAWRTTIGKKPVDSTSELFNKQQLAGIDGLKRFLLTHRQDQFARAMVYKLSSYALGRPLTFSDRADIEKLTHTFRQKEDRLGDLVELIITSDLFLQQSPAN